MQDRPTARPPERPERPASLIVDVSEKTLTVEPGNFVIPIETARRGTGHIYKSKKTPIGQFVVYKRQERHKFAKPGMGILRMEDPAKAGKTKHEPGRRGIHIHRNLDGKAEGTNGCVCPIYDKDMRWLWEIRRPSGGTNSDTGAGVS